MSLSDNALNRKGTVIQDYRPFQEDPHSIDEQHHSSEGTFSNLQDIPSYGHTAVLTRHDKHPNLLPLVIVLFHKRLILLAKRN